MSQVDLPIGKWQIYGDEEQGGLDISAVDSQGNFTGSAFGDKISGSFHGVSRKIHFARRFASSVDTFQVYTGHLSIVAINVDNTQYLLAGFYETFPGPVTEFGWYATITKPVVGP